MSDRLLDAFDFRGRLGRDGRRRLELKLTLVVILAWVGAILMLMSGAPRALAGLALLPLPAAAVAFVGAGVRRLHDVGLSARTEALKDLGALCLLVGPLIAAAVRPDLPEPAVWALVGLSAATFIALVGVNVVRGRPEWGPGDPGPNRYGPPPPR